MIQKQKTGQKYKNILATHEEMLTEVREEQEPKAFDPIVSTVLIYIYIYKKIENQKLNNTSRFGERITVYVCMYVCMYVCVCMFLC